MSDTPLTPADPAPVVDPAEPVSSPAPPEPPADPAPRTPDQYEAEIARLRKEAAGWRTKLREVEPKAQAYDEAQEAQKTEIQKAQEAAQEAQKLAAARETELAVLRAAAKHGVLEEDYDLLGSGTPEELDARAARIVARYPSSAPPPPPSDRPVEALRPGASPTPPPPADTSYPAAWKP